MIRVQGHFATAKVYADRLDDITRAQIKGLCDHPCAQGSTIRVMPDVHAGKGCTIGTTMTIADRVVPNLVGVDIGCGMLAVELGKVHIEYSRLDKVIREFVPSGKRIRSETHAFAGEVELDTLRCKDKIAMARARNSVGTLGGGNHFIEIDEDEEKNLYLVIHSGSRHLGVQIAEAYQHLAAIWMRRQAVTELMERYQKEGRQSELQQAIADLKTAESGELAFLSGAVMEDYLHDMAIAQRYADVNRRAMADVILRKMKFGSRNQFSTIHNYIDLERRILRKGAVSAQAGEQVLIPMNMRDGSILAVGLGNADWNFSAPHGAGRLMSRKDAMNSLTVSDFKRSMQGIYTTSVGRDTLDESPQAYKAMDTILAQIGDTVNVQKVLRPAYNFKAGGD